ncbi:hypothetical protein SmJEL517_g06208 [Synchytrium microbalum]|uniref:Uncharacterized protein n=1 Tax=Synchytrium microbalum TaxID=1806994 RepID=A0A507BQT4_9FUNG|nr:uncharacterized protein SmJEL517_g06208 [Synchytrium microbalum]TPX30172.1 hypothetical protein SmJEL517_g06208 [Synchytrium microbalum]
MHGQHHQHHHHDHTHAPSIFEQSLDELDFERSLHGASSRGDIDRVRWLLNRNALVNARDSSGLAALHYAARAGSIEVVEALLLAGADANTTSSELGCTPLHKAASGGKNSFNIAQILLKHGADPYSLETDGRTPLHVACDTRGSESDELVQLLLKAAPDAINRKDQKGRLPNLEPNS